jgi:hypothetical protein
MKTCNKKTKGSFMEIFAVMPKNIVVIQSPSDLKQLIHYPLYFSGNIEEEMDNNEWRIMLSVEGFSQDFSVEAIEKFFNDLIVAKEQELGIQQATLYVWFSANFEELQFSFVSGKNTRHPFFCKIREVSEVSSIVKSFLDVFHKTPVSYDNSTYSDFNEEEWRARNEEYGRTFVLDVYVRYLNEKTK